MRLPPQTVNTGHGACKMRAQANAIEWGAADCPLSAAGLLLRFYASDISGQYHLLAAPALRQNVNRFQNASPGSHVTWRDDVTFHFPSC